MHQALTSLSPGFLGRILLASLLGLADFSGLTLATLVLHVLVVNGQSLVNLSTQCVIIIKPVTWSVSA